MTTCEEIEFPEVCPICGSKMENLEGSPSEEIYGKICSRGMCLGVWKKWQRNASFGKLFFFTGFDGGGREEREMSIEEFQRFLKLRSFE